MHLHDFDSDSADTVAFVRHLPSRMQSCLNLQLHGMCGWSFFQIVDRVPGLELMNDFTGKPLCFLHLIIYFFTYHPPSVNVLQKWFK